MPRKLTCSNCRAFDKPTSQCRIRAPRAVTFAARFEATRTDKDRFTGHAVNDEVVGFCPPIDEPDTFWCYEHTERGRR